MARVSPNFFALLGVAPQLGRAFSSEDGQVAGPPVVMISDALWRSHFGGDRNIVGQTVTLDTQPYSIIGVLPASSVPVRRQADVWSPALPKHHHASPTHPGALYLQLWLGSHEAFP